MDAIKGSIAAVADSLGAAGTAAALAGVAMLVILLVALVVHRRRQHTGTTSEGSQGPAPTLTEPAVGTIRRPVYADPLLLDDLLAHAETRDYGRELRATLDDESAATTETRKLNKVLAGLEQRRMLVDLDDDPEAALANGTAVRVTGTLEELPASAVAELLELSAPVLVHSTRSSSNGNGDRGQRAVATAPFADEAPEPTWGAGAKVMALTPDGSERRYLVVLHPDGARDLDRRPLSAGPVTVLGVAEEVLSRRDKLEIDDYLGPYLSAQVRDRVRGSRLSDAAESVAQLAGSKVRRRDLTFEGPGARLSVAAVYRE